MVRTDNHDGSFQNLYFEMIAIHARRIALHMQAKEWLLARELAEQLPAIVDREEAAATPRKACTASLAILLTDLRPPLDPRLINALDDRDVRTVGDVLNKELRWLQAVPCVGPRSIDRLLEALEVLGFRRSADADRPPAERSGKFKSRIGRAMETRTAAARMASQRAPRTTRPCGFVHRPDAEARQWAKSQGMAVPTRGRVPAKIMEAYQRAAG